MCWNCIAFKWESWAYFPITVNQNYRLYIFSVYESWKKKITVSKPTFESKLNAEFRKIYVLNWFVMWIFTLGINIFFFFHLNPKLIYKRGRTFTVFSIFSLSIRWIKMINKKRTEKNIRKEKKNKLNEEKATFDPFQSSACILVLENKKWNEFFLWIASI